MKLKKRKKLETAGWRVGSAAEFLSLTDQESAIMEIKLSLARFLRSRRERACLSQTALAERLGSSQSRVAKMEAGDAGVSIELMIRAAIATGAASPDVIRAMAPPRRYSRNT